MKFPIGEEDGTNWEAHSDMPEMMEKEDVKTGDSIKDDAMRMYLNNTNLLSKRIVNAIRSV